MSHLTHEEILLESARNFVLLCKSFIFQILFVRVFPSIFGITKSLRCSHIYNVRLPSNGPILGPLHTPKRPIRGGGLIRVQFLGTIGRLPFVVRSGARPTN